MPRKATSVGAAVTALVTALCSLANLFGWGHVTVDQTVALNLAVGAVVTLVYAARGVPVELPAVPTFRRHAKR